MEDDQKPATKQDLERLRSEFKQDSETLRAEIKQESEGLRAEFKQESERLRAEFKQESEMLRSEFQHAFDDLKETMRDRQTELLKAFYSYSQTADARVTAAEEESAALKKRLGIVESRLTEVERRLNMPPQD